MFVTSIRFCEKEQEFWDARGKLSKYGNLSHKITLSKNMAKKSNVQYCAVNKSKWSFIKRI